MYLRVKYNKNEEEKGSKDYYLSYKLKNQSITFISIFISVMIFILVILLKIKGEEEGWELGKK